jgi:hypothetical protein
MLRQVADGVLIHRSELLQNNAVVVQGRAGVLLMDPILWCVWYRIPDASGSVPGVSPSTETATWGRLRRMGRRR